jgi:hypothetical protein
MVFGLLVGLAIGLRNGWLGGLVGGVSMGFGVGFALSIAYPATWLARLAFIQMWLAREAPLRMLRLLEDSRDRHILRTMGPVYQFRHARLQDLLADAYQKKVLGASSVSESTDREDDSRTDDEDGTEIMALPMSQLKSTRLAMSFMLTGFVIVSWSLTEAVVGDKRLFYVFNSLVVAYFVGRLASSHVQLHRLRKVVPVIYLSGARPTGDYQCLIWSLTSGGEVLIRMRAARKVANARIRGSLYLAAGEPSDGDEPAVAWTIHSDVLDSDAVKGVLTLGRRSSLGDQIVPAHGVLELRIRRTDRGASPIKFCWADPGLFPVTATPLHTLG